METGQFSDNLKVTETRLVSDVEGVLKSSKFTFQNVGDRLDPLGKSVDVFPLFLIQPSGILSTCVNDSTKVLVSYI